MFERALVPDPGRIKPGQVDQHRGAGHYKPEEIITKLRQVEVLASQGKSAIDAIRSIDVTCIFTEKERFCRHKIVGYQIYGNVLLDLDAVSSVVENMSREMVAVARAEHRLIEKIIKRTSIRF